MKKILFTLLILIIILSSISINIFADEVTVMRSSYTRQLLNTNDSRFVENEIARRLDISTNETIIKMFSVEPIWVFSEYYSIEDVITHSSEFVWARENNRILTSYLILNNNEIIRQLWFNADDSITVILSESQDHREVVLSNGEKAIVSPGTIEVDNRAVSAFLDAENMFGRIARGIVIENTFYFNGNPRINGSAIYFVTNQGDFVYFSSRHGGEYLFPARDFHEFAKAVMVAREPYRYYDGGFSDMFDLNLSRFDLNSAEFSPIVDSSPPSENVGSPNTGFNDTNTIVLWCSIAGVAIATAAIMNFVKARKKKRI